MLVLCCKLNMEHYKALADELGILERIVFLEDVSDDDLISLYSGCHCLVFPSLYEGFGLPILEAMRCGAPVITSNVSSCPEVAGDAAILVNPYNINEITEALNQIGKDQMLRKNLMEKGFKRASLFSWDKMANEMKQIYSLA